MLFEDFGKHTGASEQSKSTGQFRAGAWYWWHEAFFCYVLIVGVDRIFAFDVGFVERSWKSECGSGKTIDVSKQ